MDARSSGDLRGKQRVYWAAQLIGLMADDSLMTAACDLFSFFPLRAWALCNSGSLRQQRQSRSVFSLTQYCTVCIPGFVLTALFFKSFCPAGWEKTSILADGADVSWLECVTI